MKVFKLVVTVVVIFCGLFAVQCWALSTADFQTIGRRYGLSPYLLEAIALVESQHGELAGEYTVSDVVSGSQLTFLRKIAQHTGRALADFKGSYRGAMGYMQIMPATFHTFAQDGNGDGIRDPLDPYDSLATAAYYLARQIALADDDMRVALKKYNRSDSYCTRVLALVQQLEAESQLASSR
jgi:membrane-bound lytic murein transglycosylase B